MFASVLSCFMSALTLRSVSYQLKFGGVWCGFWALPSRWEEIWGAFFKSTNNPKQPMSDFSGEKCERGFVGVVVAISGLDRNRVRGRLSQKLQVPASPESLRACAEKQPRQMFCLHAIFVSRLSLARDSIRHHRRFLEENRLHNCVSHRLYAFMFS